MPWMENIVAMLGMHAACNPEDGGSEQLFALNREAPKLPVPGSIQRRLSRLAAHP